MAEVFEDPQVRHRGMRVAIPHPAGVNAPGVANPMKFSATPVAYDRPPPQLGQHTDEVLGGVLGCDAARIAALRAAGVV
jgi:crotonobetainyl-CoA:carnitine CoA-transferase CaiB-like acyl-CoA transferase